MELVTPQLEPIVTSIIAGPVKLSSTKEYRSPAALQPTQQLFTHIDPVQCESCGKVISGNTAADFRALRQKYIELAQIAKLNPVVAEDLYGTEDAKTNIKFDERQITLYANERALNEVGVFRFCDRTAILFPKILPPGVNYSNPNKYRIMQAFKDRLKIPEAAVVQIREISQNIINEATELYIKVLSGEFSQEGQALNQEAAFLSTLIPLSLKDQPITSTEQQLIVNLYPELSMEEKLALINNPPLTVASKDRDTYIAAKMKKTPEEIEEILRESPYVPATKTGKAGLEEYGVNPGRRPKPKSRKENQEDEVLNTISEFYRKQQELKQTIEDFRTNRFMREILNRTINLRRGGIETPGSIPQIIEPTTKLVTVISRIGTAEQKYRRVPQDPRINYNNKPKGVLTSIANSMITSSAPLPPSALKIGLISEYVDPEEEEMRKIEEEQIRKAEEELDEELRRQQVLRSQQTDPDLSEASIIGNPMTLTLPTENLLPPSTSGLLPLPVQSGTLGLPAPSISGLLPPPAQLGTLLQLPPPSSGSLLPLPASNLLPLPQQNLNQASIPQNLSQQLQFLPTPTVPLQPAPSSFNIQGQPLQSINPLGMSQGPSIGILQGNLVGGNTFQPGAFTNMPNSGLPTLNGGVGSSATLGGGGSL